MISAPFPGPRPFLLNGSRGSLLATYFAPCAEPHPAGDILVVPPFAEEMNRCRAMVALQARALAEIGIGTLVVDMHGTGDSAGDFVDANWDVWRDDLARALAWLRAFGNGCSSLWGLRLGAIMAVELAKQDGHIAQLLFWQPVLNGKLFYTQFLRIRIAAELDLPNRIKSTNELREKSANGEAIEVSGYYVGPELSLALDRLDLSGPEALKSFKTDWFEVLAGTTGLILLIASRVSKEWIEVVFGVDPDGGNGLLENAIALALLGTALVSFAFARGMVESVPASTSNQSVLKDFSASGPLRSSRSSARESSGPT